MKSTIEKALQRKNQHVQKGVVPEKAESGNEIQNTVVQPQVKSDETSVERSFKEVSLANKTETEKQTLNTSDKIINIDLNRLESLGFVTMSDTRRRINEEYREIKRKLLLNAFGPLSSTLTNSNIIMVTSSRPSEGKTFTAVNLALSIAAEQDKTVLLVDADVLKPNVLRTLGKKSKLGLMDYLQSDAPLSEYIYKTNIDKLRIIPAGSSHHLSTELLASDVMHQTVNEFSTRYPDRVVIIDTPPIIGINESAVLSSFAGQAVVVVEEGKSKMNDIQKTMELLSEELAVGFVVNKAIKTQNSGGYYGYYYYGERDTDKQNEA